MNYQSLKWMIESIIKWYKCPGCHWLVSDANIDIIWAAGSTINIDIECSNCKKHSMIKSEVVSINLTDLTQAKQQLGKIKNSLAWLQGKVQNSLPKAEAINDDAIIELNNNLKPDTISVEEFLDEGE